MFGIFGFFDAYILPVYVKTGFITSLVNSFPYFFQISFGQKNILTLLIRYNFAVEMTIFLYFIRENLID